MKLSEKWWNDLEKKLALTCGIPPNADVDRWKAKVIALSDGSDGMLAPYKSEVLTAVSAAGSHKTANHASFAGMERESQGQEPRPRFRPLVRRRVPFSGKGVHETAFAESTCAERDEIHASPPRDCVFMHRPDEGLIAVR